MARLYTNENFPYQGAIALRKMGHDVLTVQEAGNANQNVERQAHRIHQAVVSSDSLVGKLIRINRPQG